MNTIDQILFELRVEKDQYFEWIRNQTYPVEDKILTSEKRDDQLNAMLYLTLKHLTRTMGSNAFQLNPADFIQQAANYMNEIFKMYCKVVLLKNDVVIDAVLEENLNTKIINTKIPSVFERWLKSRFSDDVKPNNLYPAINLYSFGMDVEDTFIYNYVKSFIPVSVELNISTELTAGMVLCGCTLVKRVSKKEFSEVWEAVRNHRKLAVKLVSLKMEEKAIEKLTNGRSFTKIVEYIKSQDVEYLTFQKLHSFPYKVDYFDIDYYHPTRSKVKIMSWFDGPIDKMVIEDKRNFIYGIYEIMYSFHQSGLMYNSINPSHIMVKPLERNVTSSPNVKTIYRLVDLAHVCNFKEQNKNMLSHYLSLPILSGSEFSTPYDDLESVLYLINDLISSKIVYSDRQDEINKKTELSAFCSGVRDAINSLRILRQNDEYVNSLNTPTDYNTYINRIYINGITINGGSTHISGIQTIFGTLFNSYREVSEIEISLTKPDYELLTLIKRNIVQFNDPMFNNLMTKPIQLNEVCLAILNYQIHGYTPSTEFQPYVTSYFNR